MKIVQAFKKEKKEWEYLTDKSLLVNPLVFVFANRMLLENKSFIEEITKEFPYDNIIFGSTSGEIMGTNVFDNTASVTAIQFEKSSFIIQTENILNHDKDAAALGKILYSKMPKENLKHLFVISEGSFTNGSSLINGLESDITKNISITGGICGDDARFERTLASYNEMPKEGEVILIGFYGDSLEISFASSGGWQPFGPERIITRAEANILYEIDGQPALELYKKYLGEKADELPQASLLYPLNVTAPGKGQALVRTILSIDNESQSMVLAGDVPQNSKVQLMMANIDGIAHGALLAAEYAMEQRKTKPEIAILISCVGRKLAMSQRVEEEIEQVKETIGNEAAITGFYSYGEIAPSFGSHYSQLHNQTMTLTLLSE